MPGLMARDRKRSRGVPALLVALTLAFCAPAGAEPSSHNQPPPRQLMRPTATQQVRQKVPPPQARARTGWFTRIKNKIFKKSPAPAGSLATGQQAGAVHTATAPRPTDTTAGSRSTATAGKTDGHKRLGWKAALGAAREEFQVYRGDRLERWGNRIVVGKSDFNARLSVRENLAELVKDKGLEHYYADVNGKQVLHVVVDLASGKGTRSALRSVMRRVGNETIELNYKAATDKNVYGHVAVRVGDGALYDLTGTRGVAQLPKFLENTLQAVRGTSSLSFARKRSLRRFMESRTEGPNASASVFFGMLFSASKGEVKETQQLYNQRIKQVKAFNVSGGDSKEGVYSCAQFLTEDVPFFNSRGIGANIGAKSTASAGRSSAELEAVVVYKMPSVKAEQVKSFP